jgi:DNA-binding XRE family transcriptional regulator
MGDDDLRHLRASLRALQQNVGESARIQRRIRHGLHVIRRRLEAWVITVSTRARSVADAPPDSWPQDSTEFGAAVRRTREGAGWTRAKLAALVGVSDTTISNIEIGRACRMSTRLAILEAFAHLSQLEKPPHGTDF